MPHFVLVVSSVPRCPFTCQHLSSLAAAFLRLSSSFGKFYFYIFFCFSNFLKCLPRETSSSTSVQVNKIISSMFCRRCWIDFTAGEDYVVCAGPCAWPYHATCAAVPRELARELRRNSANNFANNFARSAGAGIEASSGSGSSSSSGFGSGMEWYCRNCRQLYRLQLYFEVATSETCSCPI